MPPQTLNSHKGQLYNIKYYLISFKNPVVVSVLKHLNKIDSECRPDKHSAHLNPQMTQAGTHKHTHTHKSSHKLEYTHKRGRVLLKEYGGHRAWVGSEREREGGREEQTKKKMQRKRMKML